MANLSDVQVCFPSLRRKAVFQVLTEIVCVGFLVFCFFGWFGFFEVLFSGNDRTKFPLKCYFFVIKMLSFYFLSSEEIEFIAQIQVLLTVWFEFQKLVFDYAVRCDLGKKSG